MKDSRDPKKLGLLLLGHKGAQNAWWESRGIAPLPLHHLADNIPLEVPDYPDEGPVERYGDPRLIPSTLPN